MNRHGLFLFVNGVTMKNVIITGSHGKSSCARLVTEAMEQECAEYRVYMASFDQLDDLAIHPDVLIVTNICSYPLKNMTSYHECVEKIDRLMEMQTKEDLLILNADYIFILSMISGPLKGRRKMFRPRRDESMDVWIDHENDFLMAKAGGIAVPVASRSRLKIPGLRADEVYCACTAFLSEYMEKDKIAGLLKSFSGAEGHFEYVGSYRGGSIFNNACSVLPSDAVYSLMPFYRKVIFITGGLLKGWPYRGLGLINVTYASKLILIGESADEIERETKKASCYDSKKIRIYKAGSIGEAVDIVQKIAEEGDPVVFSPSTPLWDPYDYLAASDEFKGEIKKMEDFV